jgi:hypothetical protein
MAKCCGSKAIIKKIKVGDEAIPVIALEAIMFLVFNMNLNNDEMITNALMSKIEEMGNKIPSDKEKEFESSVMKEYKMFVEKIKLNRNKKIIV